VGRILSFRGKAVKWRRGERGGKDDRKRIGSRWPESAIYGEGKKKKNVGGKRSAPP